MHHRTSAKTGIVYSANHRSGCGHGCSCTPRRDQRGRGAWPHVSFMYNTITQAYLSNCYQRGHVATVGPAPCTRRHMPCTRRGCTFDGTCCHVRWRTQPPRTMHLIFEHTFALETHAADRDGQLQHSAEPCCHQRKALRAWSHWQTPSNWTQLSASGLDMACLMV